MPNPLGILDEDWRASNRGTSGSLTVKAGAVRETFALFPVGLRQIQRRDLCALAGRMAKAILASEFGDEGSCLKCCGFNGAHLLNCDLGALCDAIRKIERGEHG